MRSVAGTAFRAASVAVLLGLVLPTVLAHGDDESSAMNMDMGMDMDMGADSGMQMGSEDPAPEVDYPPSYFSHQEHRAVLVAHIGFMIVAWLVVLPLCKLPHSLRFSTMRS